MIHIIVNIYERVDSWISWKSDFQFFIFSVNIVRISYKGLCHPSPPPLHGCDGGRSFEETVSLCQRNVALNSLKSSHFIAQSLRETGDDKNREKCFMSQIKPLCRIVGQTGSAHIEENYSKLK